MEMGLLIYLLTVYAVSNGEAETCAASGNLDREHLTFRWNNSGLTVAVSHSLIHGEIIKQRVSEIIKAGVVIILIIKEKRIDCKNIGISCDKKL